MSQILKKTGQVSAKTMKLADQIVKICAEEMGTDPALVTSRQRGLHVSYPRMLSMALISNFLPVSERDIGAMFGGFTRRTVLNAKARIDELIAKHDRFRKAVMAATKKITKLPTI